MNSKRLPSCPDGMLALCSRLLIRCVDGAAIRRGPGQALLTTFSVTAFEVSYAVVSAALLIISAVMLRSNIFSKATASAGMLANASALVALALFVLPVISGILSLIAGVVLGIWVILIGRRLFQLAQGDSKEQARLTKYEETTSIEQRIVQESRKCKRIYRHYLCSRRGAHKHRHRLWELD